MSDRLILNEALTGTKDGVNLTYTVAFTPTDTTKLAIYFGTPGVRLEQSSGTLTPDQYSISGTTITVGLAPYSTDALVADYPTPGASLTTSLVRNERPTGSLVTWTLANTPYDAASVVVWAGTPAVRFTRVTGTPLANEFSISGAVITLGTSLTATDGITVDYLATIAPTLAATTTGYSDKGTFYKGLRSTAARLLASFGRDLELRHRASSSYSPDSGLVTTTENAISFRGAVMPISRSLVDGTTILADDRTVLAVFDSSPLVDDRVRIDGTDFHVIQVQATNPGGTAVMHSLVIRA